MHIEKVRIEGFRLIEDEEIMLEQTSTVIVGRNNSGKTSLTDVFDRFTGEAGPRFRLEDFSAGIRSKFIAAKGLQDSGATLEIVLSALPVIAITLTFAYDVGAVDLGPLSPFIIDLDATCTTAIARVEYPLRFNSVHACLITIWPLTSTVFSRSLPAHLFLQFWLHHFLSVAFGIVEFFLGEHCVSHRTEPWADAVIEKTKGGRLFLQFGFHEAIPHGRTKFN